MSRVADPVKQFESRLVRAVVPILVSMTSGTLTVREFTLDLSEGGIFLLTDRTCPVGSLVALTFRASPFDDPFRLKAKIVRAVQVGAGQGPAGLGIEFIDPSDDDRERLEDLVVGVRSASIAEALRKSIKESKQPIEAVLRGRPTGQKMMLALVANSREITALIRDGNPAVLLRLLVCPRLEVPHIKQMLRNKGLPTRVLTAVHNEPRWMKNDELLYMYCAHPASPLKDVLEELPNVPVALLHLLSTDMTVRSPIRIKAAQLVKQSGWVPPR